MQTYVILRRGGWETGEELEKAAARSSDVGDNEMSDDIRWIRSYVLDEGAGSVGTVCIYQASSPEAIRDHASRADLPVSEIIEVADTVIVRPDPEPADPATRDFRRSVGWRFDLGHPSVARRGGGVGLRSHVLPGRILPAARAHHLFASLYC